jgi:hypothetical protein
MFRLRRRYRSLLCSAFAAGLLVAAPAWADGAADLKAGIEAYDLGEMERAATPLQRATVSGATARERATAWLYLGMSQVTRKLLDDARRSFVRAVLEDRTVAPDRERTPPAILREWDAVRKVVTGELRVEAEELGARVFVDGQARGSAPLTLRLPLGSHTVRVVSADAMRIYEDAPVEITGKAPVVVRARLVPRVGRLKLTVSPAGTRVYSLGKLIATTPTPPISFPAGRHKLVLRADGHADASPEATVEPGKEFELRVSLAPSTLPWYTKRRTWGWISLGLAGASTILGVVFGRSAVDAQDQVREESRLGLLDTDRYRSLSADISSNARLSNIFFGVAGAAAITGVVLVLWGDKDAPSARGVRLVPTFAGAALSGRF